MATIDLATINLCPGGSDANIEPQVDVEFTENNTYSVYPSTGYDAVEKVNVTVNIQDDDQILHYIYLTIPENQSSRITAVQLYRGRDGFGKNSGISPDLSLPAANNYCKTLFSTYAGKTVLLAIIGNDKQEILANAADLMTLHPDMVNIETKYAKDFFDNQGLTTTGTMATPIILPIAKMDDIKTISVPANITGVIGVDTTNIEETKTVDITANGTYNVLPTNGLLKSVTVNVKTPQLASATLEVTNINPDKNADDVWVWDISFSGGEEEVILDASGLYEAILDSKDMISEFQPYDFQENIASIYPHVNLKNEFTLFFPADDLETSSSSGLYWYYPGTGDLIYGRIVF